MSESVEERIARLLAEGLELFGENRIQEAAIRWREVLALDPEQAEARDYLDSAGLSPSLEARQAAEAARQIAEQALAQAESGEAEEALPLLRQTAESAPEDLEVQAALELVRAHLHAHYRERTKQGAGRPRVRVGPEQLLKFNLPPDAGFVLSMVDGQTRVEDLVMLLGMDPFEALHLLCRLENAGIVGIES